MTPSAYAFCPSIFETCDILLGGYQAPQMRK